MEHWQGRAVAYSWKPACTLTSPAPFRAAEPERSLKPYSLVRPLLVSALRPVVLLPECLAPRLIRNLLDLPSSRLDFQVCPAGEPASLRGEGQGWGGRIVLGSQAHDSCWLPLSFSLYRKPVWGGAGYTISTWSPQGPACHPWAGWQDPCHPGVSREGGYGGQWWGWDWARTGGSSPGC